MVGVAAPSTKKAMDFPHPGFATGEELHIFSSVPNGETEGESECRASVSAEGGRCERAGW